MTLTRENPFNEVLEAALALPARDQLRLVERVVSALNEQMDVPTSGDTEQPFTEAELAELLRVEPLTGAEIVSMGLLGGWEDMGITDSAEWVNEQKRKRWRVFQIVLNKKSH